MRRNALLAVGTFLTVVSAIPASHADLDFLRPIQVEQDEKALIAAEYSYFDLSFDFLNYLENINTGARPEESSAARVSIHMPVFQRFSFDYQHTSTNAVVSRSAQPFELDSDGTEHRFNANYWLRRSPMSTLFLHAGVTYAKQHELKIDCYDFRGLVIGGTCEEAELQLLDGREFLATGVRNYYPAMTTDANALGVNLGVTYTRTLFDRIPAYLYGGYERTRVNVHYQSKLLEITDDFILDARYKGYVVREVLDSLTNEIPQKEPWYEKTWSMEAGAKIPLGQNFFVTAALKFLSVARDEYKTAANEQTYRQNTVLNGALWYSPSTRLKVYLRGEASSNNVLGYEPIAYNRKTSRFFAHPFGQLSLGFIFSE